MKTLLTQAQLHDGVARMAAEIETAYAGRQLTIIGILTGSVVLVADLIRQIDLPMRVGVIQASSYRGATTERGELIVNSELMIDISGRDVLLVDDIFDTGTRSSKFSKSSPTSGPTRSVRPFCLAKKVGKKSIASPTSLPSKSPTNLSLATALITKICTVTCRIWPP